MKKNRFLTILIIITVIIAAVAAFLLFRYFSNNSSNVNTEEAENLISSGQYQAGLDKANEILQSHPDSVKANQVKADAAQLLQNYDLAREANQKLFELTQDNYYQEKQNYLQYGGRPANLLAGGSTIQTPVGTFIVSYDSDSSSGVNPTYSYNLWLVNGDQKESIFLDQGQNAYIGDLNLWGNSLFFRSSQGIKAINLYNNSVSDLVIDGTTGGTVTDYNRIEKLIIFNGEFYFIENVVRTSYIESNTVSKCSLDGHNVTPVVGFQGTTSVGIVTINSFFPMADRVYFRTTNNTEHSLRVQNAQGTTVLIDSGDVAEYFTVNQTDLFISAVINSAPVQVVKVGLNDASVTPLGLTSPSSRLELTATDTSLYYYGPDGLNQYDLASGSSTPLGVTLAPETEQVKLYLTGDSLIVIQIGKFNGAYKTVINRINRNNPGENTQLFTGNEG